MLKLYIFLHVTIKTPTCFNLSYITFRDSLHRLSIYKKQTKILHMKCVDVIKFIDVYAELLHEFWNL
jgi:hypothetical protein